MREDPRGRLRIYQKPLELKRYAIGCDVAEGLETGDMSTAFVMDEQYNQVAAWCGKIDPDLFGKDMVKLAKHYNNATLAIEINNHGHASMAAVKNAGYGNVYTRQVKEERSDVYTKKIGWQTNVKTKALMLDEFVSLHRDEIITIKDIDLLKEMMELIIEPDGSVGLNGKDRVVAACIACQAIKQLTGDYKAYVPDKPKLGFRSASEKIEYWKRRENKESYYD